MKKITRKQLALYLTLLCGFTTNIGYSASNFERIINQNVESNPNVNTNLVSEQVPSWGAYSKLKENIEKVQAATIVLGFSTGVMISDSFAITAAHCPLDGNNEIPDYIWARNVHGQTVTVNKVWYDLEHDFAIIRLEHPFDISCAVPLASFDALAHDTVFMVGHPANVQDAGLGWAVSFGQAYGVKDDDMSCFDINSLNGFSGGPICNSKGEVLSVVSSQGTGYYWKDKPQVKPFFNVNAPVRNEVLEQYTGYPSVYGAPLDFIHAFLDKNGIKPGPGGDFTLPENKPDRARVPFVTDEELEQIKVVSPLSRKSTVAFGRDQTEIFPFARGTGVLISDQLVLTAAHVVEKSWTTHAVSFTSGERYDGCTVLATHPLYDLAIVKLPRPAPSGYAPARLAQHPINWDEPGYAVGHPSGLFQAEGGWQVSTARGLGADKGGSVFKGSCQTGNSGGGIFDQWGNLAAILSGGSRTSDFTSPRDVQDAHPTNYWPTAQPDYGSFIGGPGFNEIKEFISRFITPDGEGYDYAYATIALPDGKIATTGRTFNGTENDVILNMYDKLGNLTNSFTSLQKNNWEAGHAMAVLTNGKIIVVGNTRDQKLSRFLTLCFNSDGTPYTEFGQNGQVITSIGTLWDEAVSVKVQQDGKILVAGTTYNGVDNDFALVRYLPDGSLDTGFGNEGVFITGLSPTSDDYLMDMEIQKDQKIVVSGYSDLPEGNDNTDWDFVTMRILSNGTVDTSFGGRGWVGADIRNNLSHDAATCLAIQEDGKIVVGGYTDRGWNPDVAVVRYLPDGARDPEFGNNGIALISDAGQNFPDFAHDLVIRSDGKLLLSGENWKGTYPETKFGTRNGSYNVAIWCLNTDGRIDESWNPKGLVTIDLGHEDSGRGMALLPQAIAVAGYSYNNGISESKLHLVDLIRNHAPASDAGVDQTVGERSTVILDGSASSDPDKDTLTYAWTAPEGIVLKSPTSAHPSFSAPEVLFSNRYIFTLVVYDGKIKSSEDEVVITVTDVNRAPVANAGMDQTVEEGNTAIVNGSASYDPDNRPVTYLWTAPEGITLQIPTIVNPFFVTPMVKRDTSYIFTLVVNDDLLNSIADTVVVTVKNINQAPVANAGKNKSVNEGAIASLDGSASFDPEKRFLTFKWTAPEGISLSSTTAAKPTFTAPKVKKDSTLTFSLLVSDGMENSLQSTVKVTVLNVINVGVPTVESPLFKVFPNPTTGIVNLELAERKEKSREVVVTNLAGAEIFRKQEDDTGKFQIDLSSQANGIYLLKVTIGNKQSINKVIVRKQ